MKFTKGIFASFLVFAFVFAAASTASAYTHMGLLKMGSTGSQVMELQKALNAKGFVVSTTGAGSVGMESTYFGAKTKAAVMAFQSANMLTADGVVGAMTGAKLASAVVVPGPGSSTGTLCPNGMTLASNCTMAPGSTTPTTPSGPLAGGAGAVSDYTIISSYNNEEVGEGEEDVVVAGLEIEADEGSDLSLTAVKLVFDEGTAASDFEDYADEVTVWLGSTKIATVEADEFNDDNDWTKTVTLSNAVIKADATGKLLVAISGISNLDSGDASDTWTVDFRSVRFVDAQGASTTEDPTESPVTFSFETFATATDIALKVALHNDSPDAAAIEVDAADNTDNVELLKFTVEAEGSDITIDDLPVLLTAANATDVDAITSNLILEVGNEEWSETVSSSGTTSIVVFDNIDYKIDEGEKVTFTVLADINDIETGTFDEGDTLKAELTTTQVDAIVAEDQNGDDITDADASGSALGDAQAFYSVGIKVEFVSESTSSAVGNSATDDIGVFEIKYKVTAFGGTVYVSDTDTATTATSFSTVPSDQVLYTASVGGTATASGLTGIVNFTTADGATDSGITNGVELADGESSVFTLEVTRTNTSTLLGSGSWKVELKGVSWATSDTATQNVYYFDLEDFETGTEALN